MQTFSHLFANSKIKPLPSHASTKKFYVGNWEGKKALFIYFENGKEERENFRRLTEILVNYGISIPKIIYVPDNDEPFLITDFVDGLLLSKTIFSEEILKKVLEEAKKFSSLDINSFNNYSPLVLDEKRIKYEFDFFLLHFCQSFLNQHLQSQIKEELYLFAEEIDKFPKAFCHRDFHSENIIVSEKSVFLLDYQDALLAPRTYDFASLYVDGYFDFPKTASNQIVENIKSYFEADEIEFKKTALQRALKALGTFGFQIVYRKKSRYICSVKRTANYLYELSSQRILNSGLLVGFLHNLQKKITSELCG